MANIKKRRAAILPPAEEKLLVVSEVELVYKSKVPTHQMPLVQNAAQAYQVLKTAWNENTIELREEFKVLLLNNAAKVLGIYHAFAGQGKAVLVDVRLVFTATMKANATGIIIAHNHPSGHLKPSNSDRSLTHKVKFVAELMDIAFVDHLIVSHESFYSMADNGEM